MPILQMPARSSGVKGLSRGHAAILGWRSEDKRNPTSSNATWTACISKGWLREAHLLAARGSAEDALDELSPNLAAPVLAQRSGAEGRVSEKLLGHQAHCLQT